MADENNPFEKPTVIDDPWSDVTREDDPFPAVTPPVTDDDDEISSHDVGEE